MLRAPVYEAVQVTPLQKMEKLSSRLDNVILVKREDRQPVHSFKLRGAYAMMAGLTDEQKARGVITASAGNHAQGVAFSSARLGLKALIVMPVATADIKVDAVRGFGGEVLLHGANFDEAKAKAIELAQQQGFTRVPPFDHPMVIAGQGTLALELLQQDAHLDRVFVPVGGGGLAAGVAVLIKQLMPQIKVIAVEAEDSACLKAALDAGHPVDLPRVGLFAEGVAVKRIGDETFRLCRGVSRRYRHRRQRRYLRGDERSVRRRACGGGTLRRAGAGGDEEIHRPAQYPRRASGARAFRCQCELPRPALRFRALRVGRAA